MDNMLSGKRLSLARIAKMLTWKELAYELTRKATKEGGRRINIEVFAIQKWHQRGIPDKWIDFVCEYFKIGKSVFLDNSLSDEQFKYIIRNPEYIRVIRRLREEEQRRIDRSNSPFKSLF